MTSARGFPIQRLKRAHVDDCLAARTTGPRVFERPALRHKKGREARNRRPGLPHIRNGHDDRHRAAIADHGGHGEPHGLVIELVGQMETDAVMKQPLLARDFPERKGGT